MEGDAGRQITGTKGKHTGLKGGMTNINNITEKIKTRTRQLDKEDHK